MIKDKKELLTIYKNYLYSLKIIEEYGDIYGDTSELIDYYEKYLIDNNIKLTKRIKKERRE